MYDTRFGYEYECIRSVETDQFLQATPGLCLKTTVSCQKQPKRTGLQP